MKRLSVILLSFLIYMPLFAQFKGTVCLDSNQSGTLDKGDKPLMGVMVTDGLNVVKTDKSGRFSLSGYKNTRFITITTPAGFKIQQFYLSTKDNRKNYDFLLSENERTKSKEHSFLHITDTEVTGGLGRWVTDLKNYINNEKPAFLIHTGDICYEPGLKMHSQIVNSGTMDCPVYYCIGNHDLVKGNYGEELYESIYGPTWYSFDIGNIHYVVTPIDHGDYPTDYTQKDVYNWLKNDLALMKKDQVLIVFNHDLLTSDTLLFKADDQPALDFRSFNIKAQIYGHMHHNYVRNQNGIYTICTSTIDKGGIDHSPSSFRDIKIDADNNIATQLRYAFIEPQATIVSPMKLQKAVTGHNGQLCISVNTYNSQAKTKQISYLLSNQENNQEIVQGILTPLTDWNWATSIPIPSDKYGKELKLTVTSYFNDGKKATDSSLFIYENDPQLPITSGESWNTLLQNAAHSGGINGSQIHLPLQLVWTANAGSNIFMTSPLIAEEKVFIATTDDNASLNTDVCAFELHTGKLIWKYRTENSIKNTIAYEDGIIVAQDAACHLYAIDAKTGQLLWKQLIDLNSYPYLTEGLTTDNGVIYAGTGAGLSAYDLKTGRVIWTNKDWKQREGSTTTLTVAGDVLISGSQWGGLYANDIYTGKLLWKLSEDGLSNRGASPVYKDNQLWIVSSKSLFIIEPETGKIINKKELSASLDVTSTPLVTDHEIIFGTADKGIMALDKSTLFIKWKAETNPSLVYTAPYSTTPQASVETSAVASQGLIYMGASDGYLYVIDASTGITKWKTNLGSPVFSSAAVSGNILVISDFSGNIYGFQSSVD